MKKYLIAFSLLFVPFLASASTSITSVADQTVYVGDTVTVDVVVNRTKTGFPSNDTLNTTNDWQSTEIGGVCYNAPDLYLGTGLATTSYSFTATSTAGSYSVPVRVFRFDNCDDNFFFAGQPSEDDSSFTLDVEEVPAPVVSMPSKGHRSGGGGYMGPVYYGFTSESDKTRWQNYDERQKMIGEWRYRMCKEVGAFCGK